MKNKYYIIILLLSFSFSEKSNWATTRFETFWKKNFTQMIYREPITLLPYDIKIGYLKYGGDDYYKQFKNLLSSSDIMNDMKQYIQLNKEYKDLQPIIDAYQEYKNIGISYF